MNTVPDRPHRVPIHTSEGQQPPGSYRPLLPAGEELLTPAEVAAVFRVDPKTVTRWAKAGKLRSLRTLGGHRRFYRSEVDALMRGEQIPGTALWAVRYTRDGGQRIRACASDGHARAVLGGLPGHYHPAVVVTSTDGVTWSEPGTGA